jgi:O-antigen/teichoic acid export membrane protein
MFTFDLVLLGFLIGEREVGLYGAAYRVCFLALAIGVALHTSYLPAFSRGALLGTEEASRIARRAMEFASAMAAPLVVGGVLLADPLLRALFGASYAEGAQALRVLLLSIGLIFLHGTFRNILLAYDRTGVETCIMAAAASINVALNFLLIPRFGLLGAAAATAAAEALVLALEAAAVRSLNVRLPWSATYRALCAALVMGLALSLMRDALHVAGSIALGALVYVVVLAMLGGIPADARQRLRFRTRRL